SRDRKPAASRPRQVARSAGGIGNRGGATVSASLNIIEQFRADDARVLDRLVDGELSASERRELLSALDDEPGAWRRCALAFLESQALRSQLGSLAVESTEPALVTRAERPQPVSAGNRVRTWGALAAVAAGLLLAFGLGTRFSTLGQSNETTLAQA